MATTGAPTMYIGVNMLWPATSSAVTAENAFVYRSPMPEMPIDFTVDDESGRPWRLSEHLGYSVVLLFLRGDW